MRRGLLCLHMVSALWLAVAAAADQVTIPAVRDNTLFEDASGALSNGAGPVLFAGNNGQDLARRALLRFDIAGSLPPGASVGDVILTLNVSNATNTTPRIFTLHRLLRDWGEGTSSTTSGSGAPATTDDATWLHTFYSSQWWDGPGGDFVSTATASQSVSGVGLYTWADAGLSADVQAWLDHPTTNFGWLIQSDEVTLNTARRFDSRENGVAANRPSLSISYSNTVGVPVAAAKAGLWLGPSRPNPAAGPVQIAFQLPAPGHVRLEVMDPAGRRVGTLADGDLGPGRHEVTWSARDAHGAKVPAGVYFYRLVVDGRSVAARRLALMP